MNYATQLMVFVDIYSTYILKHICWPVKSTIKLKKKTFFQDWTCWVPVKIQIKKEKKPFPCCAKVKTRNRSILHIFVKEETDSLIHLLPEAGCKEVQKGQGCSCRSNPRASWKAQQRPNTRLLGYHGDGIQLIWGAHTPWTTFCHTQHPLSCNSVRLVSWASIQTLKKTQQARHWG